MGGRVTGLHRVSGLRPLWLPGTPSGALRGVCGLSLGLGDGASACQLLFGGLPVFSADLTCRLPVQVEPGAVL